MRDRGGIGGRLGQLIQGSGVREPPTTAVPFMVPFVFV
jgi:hypothetical protein